MCKLLSQLCVEQLLCRQHTPNSVHNSCSQASMLLLPLLAIRQWPRDSPLQCPW